MARFVRKKGKRKIVRKRVKVKRAWRAPKAVRAHPFLSAIALLCVLFLLIGIHNTSKTLPRGLSFMGEEHAATVAFLADRTFEKNGSRVAEQEIFDHARTMIGQARKLIVADFFLFNDFQGQPVLGRPLSSELAEAIIAQKAMHPLEAVVITDPINTVYGSIENPQLNSLEEAGVKVTFTNLNRLRDSNPLYSSVWRVFFLPFGTGPGLRLPNPLGEGRVSLRSYLTLLNFKANHRKTLVVDEGDTYRALVTSANPHDASSAHSNVGVTFTGPAALDVLRAETAVMNYSGGYAVPIPTVAAEEAETTVQVVSEGAIRQAVLSAIRDTKRGDTIDLAMFYLSDRGVVRALKEARWRGVSVRIVLDPNKDAFGREKNGIPNRQVGLELHHAGIEVRWADTHGEQFHTKLLIIHKADGSMLVIVGSANYTRRNLQDLNLELDVVVRGANETQFMQDASAYFSRVWNNEDGVYTVPFTEYEDTRITRIILYHLMEWSGLSTF
ncbi:phospholipase [Candidatus Woesearchaeota archaeon]|nr:MAG: phospholipase [Candidatus Woesearchaeota archaeon]